MAAPLTIRIRSETSDAEKGLQRVKEAAGNVQGSMGGIEGAARSAGAAIKKFGEAFLQNVSYEVVAGLRRGIVGLSKDMIAESEAMGKAMKELSAVYEASVKSFAAGFDYRQRQRGGAGVTTETIQSGVSFLTERVGTGLNNALNLDFSQLFTRGGLESLLPILTAGRLGGVIPSRGSLEASQNVRDADAAYKQRLELKEAFEKANRMDEDRANPWLRAEIDRIMGGGIIETANPRR